MKQNKQSYETPTLNVLFLEMEQGIAANSATVVPGGDGATTPDIEDWKDGGTFKGSKEL